jgi:aminomethyltransferase
VGRAALEKQSAALKKILSKDFSAASNLRRVIRPMALTARGVARAGAKVFKGDRQIGTVTSGTMVPYWVFEDDGSTFRPTDRHKMRSICLALMDSTIVKDETVHVEIRGKAVDAVVVGRHLRSDTPPYALPILR